MVPVNDINIIEPFFHSRIYNITLTKTLYLGYKGDDGYTLDCLSRLKNITYTSQPVNEKPLPSFMRLLGDTLEIRTMRENIGTWDVVVNMTNGLGYITGALY